MNIQDFVEETLRQIMQGVKNAGEHAKGLGGAVNPFKGTGYGNADDVPYEDGFAEKTLVGFDLQVVAVDSATTEKGAKIAVLGQGGGLGKATGHEHSETSRVRFKVKVMLPHMKVEGGSEE